jgi:hypothetical protein
VGVWAYVTVTDRCEPLAVWWPGELPTVVRREVVGRRTLDSQVEAASPFGTVGFEESFEITAQSLVPR